MCCCYHYCFVLFVSLVLFVQFGLLNLFVLFVSFARSFVRSFVCLFGWFDFNLSSQLMIPVCKDMEGSKLIGETGATLDMNFGYAYVGLIHTYIGAVQ